MAQIDPDLPDVGADLDAWGPINNAATATVVTEVNAQDVRIGLLETLGTPPLGAAGGALAGSFPNPGLNETVVDSIVGARIASQGTSSRTAVDNRIAALAVPLAGLAEIIRDTIGATLVGGANIQITVNDSADTISVAVTGLSTVATSGAYADLTGKPTLVPVDSPAFTGTPTVPTATTGSTTTQVANTQFVNNAIANSGAGNATAVDNGDGTISFYGPSSGGSPSSQVGSATVGSATAA